MKTPYVNFKIVFFLFLTLTVFDSGYSSATELPKSVVPEGLGVNIHFTDAKAGELEMLARGGFRYVRMDFSWESTEGDKSTYDFKAYDRLLGDLDKHHLRAVLILDYANRHYDQGLSPSSDEGRAAFARWAASAVKHFQGRNVLWEIYNEPNIDFWKPKPDVKQYVKLALAVGKAIKAEAADETYIGPATSGIDFTFLEECFRAGLLEYWAAVSVHPYREDGPETAVADYAKLRTLIDQYAPKGNKIPILSGEWGYSSARQDPEGTRQGKLLARQWLTNLMCDVPLSIWYDWHDDGEDKTEAEHHFGTVRFAYETSHDPVYQPKPAYLAAQTFTKSFEGFRFQNRLTTENKEDYVLAFIKGDETRWAAWTTAAAPHSIRIPLAAGRYRVVGHLGNDLSTVVADGEGLSVMLEDSPRYLMLEKGK